MDTGDYITLIICGIGLLGTIIIFSYKVGGAHSDLTMIGRNVSLISTKLNRLGIRMTAIVTYLVMKDSTASTLFNSESPLALNKLGLDLLDVSGGRTYIDNNLDLLINLVKKENPKSSLDVEQCSSAIILDVSNSDDFIAIKDFVYNNPEYKKIEITVALIASVLGIYLRDKYFEKYPEASVEKKLNISEKVDK